MTLTALLATARPASATAIAIGQFSFETLIDPIVSLTNDSAIPFSSFTVTLESDLVAPSGTTTDVRDLATNESLDPFMQAQWVAGGFSLPDPNAFLVPLRARLTSFAYGANGIISFSFDGGLTFVADPLLDFASSDTALGIFFEAAVDPTPVPEPATLALFATGLAALRRRRLTRR